MFKRAKKFLFIQILAAIEPSRLAAISEDKALKAFHKAAAHVPAYSQFLKKNNVPVDKIRTITDFKARVPIIDKSATFKTHAAAIKNLCFYGRMKNVRAIIPSSGHSGCFSYGLVTSQEMKRSREGIDFMFDCMFEAGEKTTLLINTLPMGIKVASELVTVVDTSVRADTAINLIKTFASSYSQIIIIGENAFVKKILEDGARDGVNWRELKVHLVVGEELLSENLRTYLAGLLGVDIDDPKERRLIGSSFGVAEFGLNLFYETRELIGLRRLLQRDPKFKMTLINRDVENLPGLFYYNPVRIFVEETPTSDGLSQIVLTNLETETNVPLVRYNIKDEGMTISYAHLKRSLESFGYDHYMPRIRLPIVAVWGRDKIRTDEGIVVRAEFIKDLLYKDEDVAGFITGNFRLSNSKAGLKIEVQSSKNGTLDPAIEQKIKTSLAAAVPGRTEIILYPYRDFPYGMELNYERKFQYI